MTESKKSLPNEATYIGETGDGYILIKYKGRIRKMAYHNYIKPLRTVS